MSWWVPTVEAPTLTNNNTNEGGGGGKRGGNGGVCKHAEGGYVLVGMC